MDYKILKFFILLPLFLSLVNSQNSSSSSTTSTTESSTTSRTTSTSTSRPSSSSPPPSTTTNSPSTSDSPPTTTEQPPEEEEETVDPAIIDQYNLNVGAANVAYGPYAYHRKYIPDQASDHHFSYDDNHPRGPSRWAQQWSMCGGPDQSPVNIPVDQCAQRGQDVQLQYFNGRNQPANVSIENNGYSVEYLFHFDQTPVLYGGPLTEGYVFEFIHFHWSMTDGEGSEHYLTGENYELEMHLGHRNSKYRDMAEAGMNYDGIVVLAFLFQVSDGVQNNPRLQFIDRVQSVNSSVELQQPQGFALRDFVGTLSERFVNLRGSLTTPPCSPANWIVAPGVRQVSRDDLNRLRRTRRNGQPIAPNYRPLQQRQNLECFSYGNY